MGLTDRFAGERPLNMSVAETASGDKTLGRMVEVGKELRDMDGADVIIVHGITQCPVHMRPDWLTKELGVPVVEGIGAPIRMAAMLAGLRLKHSRKRWPKSNARPNV